MLRAWDSCVVLDCGLKNFSSSLQICPQPWCMEASGLPGLCQMCGTATSDRVSWQPMCNSRWRHQMETFTALLAVCVGNSPVIGEFPAQRPMTRSVDVLFHLCLNKRLSKQSWGWYFLRRHRAHYDVIVMLYSTGWYRFVARWKVFLLTTSSCVTQNAQIIVSVTRIRWELWKWCHFHRGPASYNKARYIYILQRWYMNASS